MTDIDIERYMDLFCHRRDVFAVQHEGGAYTPVRRPLTEEDVEEHLAGLWSIGTYVVDPEGQTVKCVCFDLDTHDERLTAILCEQVERLVRSIGGDPTSLLKEFSGNKGTHVWLFLSDPVPAARVRRWIQRDFLPEWTRLTGGATLEIFPKQDSV